MKNNKHSRAAKAGRRKKKYNNRKKHQIYKGITFCYKSMKALKLRKYLFNHSFFPSCFIILLIWGWNDFINACWLLVVFQIPNIFLPKKSKNAWMEYYSRERVLSHYKRECIPLNGEISITIVTCFNWNMKFQKCYFLNVNVFFLKFKFWWMIKLFCNKPPHLQLQ